MPIASNQVVAAEQSEVAHILGKSYPSYTLVKWLVRLPLATTVVSLSLLLVLSLLSMTVTSRIASTLGNLTVNSDAQQLFATVQSQLDNWKSWIELQRLSVDYTSLASLAAKAPTDILYATFRTTDGRSIYSPDKIAFVRKVEAELMQVINRACWFVPTRDSVLGRC